MSESTQQLSVRLTQIGYEGEDIASYEFRAIEGSPLPAFDAGAHIDLFLPDNRTRSYSLANDPAERHRYVVAVQREANGRGGSLWMHMHPRVGEVFKISKPANDFPLNETARESIFICGGIGVTPALAMAHRLNTLGAKWLMHYAVRSRERAPYMDVLSRMSGEDSPVTMYFQNENQSLDVREIIASAPEGTHFYCCGPKGMIDAFIEAGKSRPQEQIHFERFAASNEASVNGEYDVVLQRSGRRVSVPKGKSMLDALLDSNVNVPYSCSSGVCGTCRVRVIDGQPDHRDDFLTVEEKAANHDIMVCCSGSLSKTLVLDL
jgi:vanillate O-demethylase ferredoxin subunit